jgi:hypothetical protein
VNAVIVLTAEVENAPGDISSAQLVHQLSRPYDRRQRIQIIVIMVGQAGNFPVLQQVAIEWRHAFRWPTSGDALARA